MATIKARLAKLEAPFKKAAAEPPPGLSADQRYAWIIRQPQPKAAKKNAHAAGPISKEEAAAVYHRLMSSPGGEAHVGH
jgi:hypothetical protein